ncbi:MAG: DUF2058 family protein, partial [Myxococcota bacterium]
DARKQDQGARKTKREREAEAAAAARAEAEADHRARSEERERQRTKADALQRRLRARNLVLGNRVDPGWGHRFFFTKPDGHIGGLDVSSGVAFQLRCGELALAVIEDQALDHVFVIKRKAAAVLRDVAPHCLRFFVADAEGLSAPDLAFHQRDWPVELGPHKATPEDLARFRAVTS